MSIIPTSDDSNEFSTNFTYACKVCGETITVIDSQEQPHRCRIDFDALAGR